MLSLLTAPSSALAAPRQRSRRGSASRRCVVVCSLVLATPLAAATDSVRSLPERAAAILERHCWACHGATLQQNGLRLDSRSALLDGGGRGPAVVLGQSETSLLLRAIDGRDLVEMPPNGPLDDAERDVLVEWIDLGAPWPRHERARQAPPIVPALEVPVPSAAFELERAWVAAGAPDFDREVRPLLSDRCFTCHGPDAATRQAGLRLDSEESVQATLPSGNRAVVPGELARSQLFRRVAADASSHRMPPAGHNPLTEAEVAVLGRWIVAGAPWEGHWAFEKPVGAGATLEVGEVDVVAGAATIDRFVAERLAQEGVEPAEPADAATLVRRLSLDLVGLPPEPELVDRFAADPSEEAYRALVEELLASPRYGEHMARSWLDAARYADTNGYHIDNIRFMWRWRDWVIDSYNRHQPFDEFTLHQLAGDLLPEATFEQKLASGFHRNHMINFEGGAIAEEYRTQYVFDRVDTTATIWLGLTVECAKCHDHKFDPVSQREYYELAAFFNSVAEEGLDGQEGNAAPRMPAPTSEQQAQLDALDRDLDPLLTLLDEGDEAIEDQEVRWRSSWTEALAQRWTVPEELTLEAEGAELRRLEDGSVLAEGARPDHTTYRVRFEATGEPIVALRLQALADETLPEGGFGRGDNGSFVLGEVGIRAGESDGNFVQAFADWGHPFLPIANAIDGDSATGWSGDWSGRPGMRTALFVLDEPLEAPAGETVTVSLKFQTPYSGMQIGRFTFAWSGDERLRPARLEETWRSGPYLGRSAAKETASDAVELLAASFRPERAVDLDDRYRDGLARWSQLRTGGAVDERETWLETDIGAGSTYFYWRGTSSGRRTLGLTVDAPASQLWLNGTQTDALPRTDQPEVEGQRRYELSLDDAPWEILLELAATEPSRAAVELTREVPVGLGVEVDAEDPATLEYEWLLATPDAQWTQTERTRNRRDYRRRHWQAWQGHEERFAALSAEKEALLERVPDTMVMAERDEPRPTFVLDRGQYDQPLEQVEATTPRVLHGLAPRDDEPADRLDLANWILSPENPLTARVVANRQWRRFFGRGIVETVSDFGSQGERPSHPELLDWLAGELQGSGWDVQRLQRMIVLSQTYRQSSKRRAELTQSDPDNRLLARGARFRLDAELIRDGALLMSGLLVEKIGGPSVSPYQPPGLWKEVGYESRGRFSGGEFVQGTGDDLYRRSLYTFWKRTVPPPNMMVLDAPNRETCTVRRSVSNTPLQALTLMNDPQFVEAARAFGQRALLHDGLESDADRVRWLFRWATSRAPAAEEEALLLELLDEQRSAFAAAPGRAEELLGVGESRPDATLEAPELASYTTLASVLLNLDETLTRR